MVGEQGGRDAFISEGFDNWSKVGSFRKHMEKSNNKGLFVEVLSLIREDNEKIFKVTLENAPKFEKLTSSTIQKDIVNCFSKEIIKSICDEIDLLELFTCWIHLCFTLKAAIDTVFSNNNLSMVHVRGQGYDGASDMSGAFNGLKSLIINENSFVHYIHCFAHQLQLVIVVVAKKHDDVEEFFEQLALVVTVVCRSCKRKDMIREMQKERVAAEIDIRETETGRGLNQEISLVRAGDTR
ncbi:uncharacterized protein LOC111906535 [Lactuca sativa]|uniref:uncharacterized protein LOC111906535 n=1 Tax=Lactuca sativa TaxID=4236 RepID=UPI000CD8EC91|nr:uncharacterized protein LOC111906535 [Lactuca sativa]